MKSVLCSASSPVRHIILSVLVSILRCQQLNLQFKCIYAYLSLHGQRGVLKPVYFRNSIIFPGEGEQLL